MNLVCEALPADIAGHIIKCYSKGLELMKAFPGRLLDAGEQKFHDPITRNPIKSFKFHVCSMFVQNQGIILLTLLI